MARPLPIEFPGTLCHSTSRGNVNIGVHDTNSDELPLDTRVYMIVD
jgi:hypothetical protein